MKDSLHRFLYVNQKVADLLGLPAEQIINRRDDEVIPAASACQLWRLDNRVFETGELQAGEEMLTDPEGNQHYYWSVKV
ncbi:PAS domain-containing protein, partial [Aeromonas veronii]